MEEIRIYSVLVMAESRHHQQMTNTTLAIFMPERLTMSYFDSSHSESNIHIRQVTEALQQPSVATLTRFFPEQSIKLSGIKWD